MSELVSNGVQIYQFPTDDEAVSEINASMNVSFCEMCFKTVRLEEVETQKCISSIISRPVFIQIFKLSHDDQKHIFVFHK